MKKLLATICAGAVLGLMARVMMLPVKRKLQPRYQHHPDTGQPYAERGKLQAKQKHEDLRFHPGGENRSRVLRG